jgi:hypothetical protein
VIEVADPRDPGDPVDVLSAGSERPPFRVSRKVALIGLAVALLGAGTFVGVDRYQLRQAELRRQAAAFAVADTVHVHVTLDAGGVTALEAGNDYETYAPNGSSVSRRPPPAVGELELPLTFSDDAAAFDTISGASLEGSDLGLTFDPSSLDNRGAGASAGTVFPMTLQCNGVVAGHYPRLGSLVLAVVVDSGRRHRLVLPLTSSTSAKELALTACNLPDPSAIPTATLEEQHGRLLLGVGGVSRSRSALHLLAIRSPGFALAQIGGDHTVPPDVNLLLDVSVRVTNCALARTGNGAVTLTLRDDRRSYTVVATDAPAADFRRPGSAWLRTLVARSC